jgi:hypothetical protein
MTLKNINRIGGAGKIGCGKEAIKVIYIGTTAFENYNLD